MGRQNFDPEQLKQNTDLRIIAERILGQPARRGSNYCQWHAPDRQDNRPSLTVWQAVYKDWGNPDNAGDHYIFLQTYAGLDFKQSLEYLADGGDGASYQCQPHRPLSLAPIIFINQNEIAAEFTDWQTAAGETVRGLPSAADDPTALKSLQDKGYTIETIKNRDIPYSAGWVEIGQDVDGRPAKIAPGIVYTHYDQHGQPAAIFTRLIDPALIKRMETKTIQTAGGKPKLGIYGNLDQHAAPVVLTAGQKDSDLVAQTHPGPVNAVTMGACGYDLPSWVIEKIAALNPPYVLVMFDNDPPSEQHEAEKRAAALRAVLTCPVLVTPPPAGFKDYSDAVTGGADVGSFWARIVAPVNVGVIELLCGMKRYPWIDKEHGDPAYLATLLIIRHEAIAQGLIDHDTPLSVTRVIRLSEVVGQPISKKAAEKGIALAVKFGLWIDFDCAEIGYSIIDKYPLSNFGPNENAAHFYMPLPTFAGYRNLAAALENEIPTSVDDWADGEFLEELHRYGIRDTRPTVTIDRYDFDGLPYQTEVSETLDLLNRLVFLTDPTALITSPFVWPVGFSLADYPNKRENERPNAVKSLRLAMLRILHEQNTRRVIAADGATVDGWQVSAAAIANRLGIGVSSVGEYRRAAGLTTCEQKSRIEVETDQNGSKLDKLTRLLNRYRIGATVWINGKPSRITNDNRQKVIDLIGIKPNASVEIELQLPSIQYAAPLETIETIHNERSDRHKKRVERAQKERAAMGDDLPKERNRHAPPLPPKNIQNAPEIAEAGYSKTFVYYHLLKLLPDLLEAAKTSLLIARVLVGYGLMKGETMPKIDSFKDTDLEAAPVVIMTTAPRPIVTAAPANGTVAPVGQGNYPFSKEKYRLPGLPTDLPAYRELQKGA